MAFAGLGYMSLLVYQRRSWALAHPKVWVPPPPEGSVAIPIDGSCSFAPTTGQGNRLEPMDGDFLFGFDLQWDLERPSDIVNKMGSKYRPLIYNTFIDINETDFQRFNIDWMAQEAKKAGAMLEITLLPQDNRRDRPANNPLKVENIPDDLLYAFALQMRRVNSYYGVPVYLRYEHEMNGDWLSAFCQRPRQMIKSYRTLANYVHALTNMTAMVWSPNIGESYPWENRAATGEAASLDTNGDRLVNEQDDPYMPYWPGTEYVDWVGFSLYQYKYNQQNLQTYYTTDGSYTDFENPLIGISSKITPPTVQQRLEFYVRFAQNYNKPFMFSETGAAFHYPGPASATVSVPDLGANAMQTNINIKQAWWRGLFNLINSGKYPNIKAACWFEELKSEPAFWDGNLQLNKTYRITWDKEVRDTFIADLGSAYGQKLKWVGDYTWDCTGKIKKH
ncbi:hypothetical protein HDV00_010895 [Rhizophlyctis rosea]|nr:hypothetical protein HDV00_010895 [Rhizophlyctis rosea]